MSAQTLPLGNVVDAGDVLVAEMGARPRRGDQVVSYALVIEFPDAEALNAAMTAGRAEFTVFGGEVRTKATDRQEELFR